MRSIAVLIAVLLLFSCAMGQDVKPVKAAEEVVEMHGVDRLETLLGFVQVVTKKVIVYDASIKMTKVKIYGTARVPKKDLLLFVQTVLEMNGFTVAEAPGNVLRVIPIKETTEPIQLRVGREKELPETSETITQVVRLKYADITKVSALVQTMVTPRVGRVAIYEDLNMLFVTDAAYKVKKVLTVIDGIDVPAPKIKLETVRIEHAPATELARMLDSLLQRKSARERVGKQALQRAYIVADDRSSSIVVLGLPEEIDEIKKVIKTLDRPLAEEEGSFHSYQLKNTSAEDLAKVLVELYQKKAAATRVVRPGTQPKREPSIVPEPNTNSLLIIAPPDVFQGMVQLIKTLDVRRPQVLIEVMLVELKLDQTTEMGLELAGGDSPSRGKLKGFAGTGFGFSTIGLDDGGVPIRVPTLGEGMFAGVFSGTTQIPVILRAWETYGDVEVLAVPRVLTNDNADATISIGDEVPYQRTTIQDDVRDVSYGFVTATMELKITPHISESDHLRLDLGFLVERFGAQISTTAPPPKSTRNATTKITIPNETTVVIGGLTHTNVSDTENRVPILGRIPLLGHLFKKTHKVRRKTHLFIFITPHILREKEFGDLDKISRNVEMKMNESRKKDWREEVKIWKEDGTEKAGDVPEIRAIDAPTVIEGKKDDSQGQDTDKVDRKRRGRRR